MAPEEVPEPEAGEGNEEEIAEVNRALLDAYADHSEPIEEGPIIVFTREANRLFAQIDPSAEQRLPLALHPLSDTTFTDENMDIVVTFHREANGLVERATAWFRNWREFTLQRRARYEPSAEELAAYAGLYYSAEIETAYTIVVEDSRLTVKHHRLEDNTLDPGVPDVFSAGWPLGQLTFERSDDGSVSGFVTQNIRFEKLK